MQAGKCLLETIRKAILSENSVTEKVTERNCLLPRIAFATLKFFSGS